MFVGTSQVDFTIVYDADRGRFLGLVSDRVEIYQALGISEWWLFNGARLTYGILVAQWMITRKGVLVMLLVSKD